MILLSTGHNPDAKGACNGNICEWDIATEWVEEISRILDIALIPNMIVPTGSLKEKVNFINEKNSFIAMELHFNSNIKAHGSETLYCPGSTKGKELADIIQKQFMMNEIFQPNRGSKEGWYKMDKNNPPDYFLRKTNCVSIIVEPDFISNLDNIEKHRRLGCLSIANGLSQYFYKYFQQNR